MHRLFLVLISLLVAGNSFATSRIDLYQAQLPVATQSTEERNKIAPDILKKVLLKVVSDSALLNSTDVTSLLSQSEQFIRQYQYHRMNKISDDLTQPDRIELQLEFNEHQINQALVELGLAVWGKYRPEILLWIAVEDNGVRTILGEGSADTKTVQTLKQALDKRGLVGFMPLMDLQDQTQLSFADLWAGFAEPIVTASQRYGAQIIVIARVTISQNDAMHIRWQSLSNNETEQWQSKGNAEEALKLGISELADRTARRFTQVVTHQDVQRHQLLISNVKGYADYMRVKDYLATLHTVSEVKLLNLANNQLEISILLASDLSIFNQTIAIGRVLEQETNYHSSDIIHYRLLL